jgi:hypothetical protein
MRDLIAIREGDSHPYGPQIQTSTLDYALAVFAIPLGLALLCGHLWALVYALLPWPTKEARGRSCRSAGPRNDSDEALEPGPKPTRFNMRSALEKAGVQFTPGGVKIAT